MARDSELHIGQWVNKVGGRYGGPGRIVGDTMALDDDGYKLWNVEHRIEGGYGKFCHVYPSSVLEVAGRDPVIETRNDNAGYVEFVNYDGPFVVRDLPAPSAVLLDTKTKRIIGYRVYDQSPAPSLNVDGPDWLRVAKLAGEYGVRYETNPRMKRFLQALGVNVEGLK